eukprot:m.413333 g.413333  ORF g.413333 m.413333 type:complete len:220 (-) comp56577_c1_seq6:1686-2345(-)
MLAGVGALSFWDAQACDPVDMNSKAWPACESGHTCTRIEDPRAPMLSVCCPTEPELERVNFPTISAAHLFLELPISRERSSQGSFARWTKELSTTTTTAPKTFRRLSEAEANLAEGWFRSSTGQSCLATCAGKQPCSEESLRLVTSDSQLRAIVKRLQPPVECSSISSRLFNHAPSIKDGACVISIPASGSTSSCRATFSGQRICCCSFLGCDTTPALG